MEYDFTKRERSFGRIVFALTLDRKKMTERILIGEASEVRRCLNGEAGVVFHDRVSPAGQFLLGFESDPGRTWNVNAMRLHESYGKLFPGRGSKWKMAKPGADFLREKYSHGEPAAMFAAIRTWEEYLACYNLNHGSQLFIDRTAMLYKSFWLNGGYLWQEEAANALAAAVQDGESQVELWYPVKKRPFECVVTSSSLLPIVFYYLHKIEEWGLFFQECKVCGKPFLAKSKHYEICSDECRKVLAVQAKREFDERAKGDRLEQLHEAAYYYWYNRLRKLKRAKNPDAEKLAVVGAAFEAFRKEAVKRKADVRSGDSTLQEFSSWLVDKQDEVDRLME